MNTTTERPAQPAGELYFPTDLSPDELFEALGRLRREAESEIERLIDLLDRTDPFFDEREHQIDDDPIDGDDDSEESLGSVDGNGNQARWASGDAGDREGDGCADDREGDEEQHGGDGAMEDGEASLGWTEDEAGRCGTGSSFMGNRADFEDAPSTLTEAALARYRTSDRYNANNDGWHVDSEQWFGDRRRIRNLSDRQRRLVKPKIDRSQVSC